MLKLGLLLCLVGLAVAVPKPGSRSPEEIEAFREFLEKSKTDDGYRFSERMLQNPKASAWENSGKFEGDIILDQWQIDELVNDFAGTRNAYIRPNTRWPGNTVVYEFGHNEFNFLQQAAILNAIRDIERNTCIRFRTRNANDRNFVRLTGRPDGCYANVGFWNDRGAHTLNLARNSPGRGCFVHTTIVHEWLHIVGIFHMQSTYNRYNYVRILWENIRQGMAHNFYRFGNNIVSNHGLAYEYISCMHYGTHGFSVNGRPTIQATRSFLGVMGQQNFVTARDWLRTRRHYNCPGAWSEVIEDELKGLDQEMLQQELQQEYELEQQEYVPEQQEYESEQQAYGSEQQEYEPEQQEYEPEQQEYVPEQQEYVPEQQAYGPEQQEYEPEQQEYEPEQQEYVPEPQEYDQLQQEATLQEFES